MSTKQLFIPDRINVGFQERHDTYTGKLAYVIYFDTKGVLRKEASWKSWRDKKIDPVEYVNEPTEGFVLNKKVGGTKGHSWDQRNTYVRVYDPRGFEFEISIPNLLFILAECDCSRGKGLEGQFVYSWDGSDLVLLPVTSQDYTQSVEFTGLKSMSVKAKDLISGATYLTKNQETLIYLGKFERYMPVSPNSYFARKGEQGITKPYIFCTIGDDGKPVFVFHYGLSKIAKLVSGTPVANYAELVEAYSKSPCGSRVSGLFLGVADNNNNEDYFCTDDGKGTFTRYVITRETWRDPSSPVTHINPRLSYVLIDGVIHSDYLMDQGSSYNPNYLKNSTRVIYNRSYYDTTKWVEPTGLVLHARLTSGLDCVVDYYGKLSPYCPTTERNIEENVTTD